MHHATRHIKGRGAALLCGNVLVAHLNVRSGSGSVNRKRFIVFAMTCGDVPAAGATL